MWTGKGSGIGIKRQDEEIEEMKESEKQRTGKQEDGRGSAGQKSVTRINASSSSPSSSILPHSIFIASRFAPNKSNNNGPVTIANAMHLLDRRSSGSSKEWDKHTSSRCDRISSQRVRLNPSALIPFLILSLMSQLFLAVSVPTVTSDIESNGNGISDALPNVTRKDLNIQVANGTDFIEEEPDLIIGLPNDVRITPDGDPIFEGDMVIPREVVAKMKLENGSATSIHDPGTLMQDDLTGRTAIGEPMLYWPDGRVVYTFHSSVTPEEKSIIESAIRHWEAETCITFREREALDYYYLRFRTDSPGCWSLVGRQFLRFGVGQDLSIGKGCAQPHVVVHEIGHAMGFFHEQSRSDRDDAIFINWENVQSGYELQFNKEEDVNFGVGYDYLSTMQYPSWAFSKEALVKDTIVTTDPKYQRLLGSNKVGLSFRDKAIINRLYKCERLCSNQDTCQNNGYLRVPAKHLRNMEERSNACECQCPPNASGKNCEIITNPNYYDAVEPLPCGGNVTEEGIIETPNYPSRSAPKQSCVWNIVAAAGKQVQIQFLGFEFAPRYDKPGSKVNGKCYHESIEIRLTDLYHGDHYCGTDIAPGTTMMSTKNQAVIMIMADEKMVGKGLRANVTFYDPSAPVIPVTPAPTEITSGGSGDTFPTIAPGTGDRTRGGWNNRIKPITVPVKPPTTIVIPLPDNGFDEAWRKIIDSWKEKGIITPRFTTPKPIPLPDWVRIG